MIETLLEYLKNLPPELATMVLAMLPITELRASIPVGLFYFDMSVYQAYFWSVLGDIIPTIFILLLLNPVASFLRKHSKIMDKFFTWLFEKTRRKHTKKFERWGALALISFVAIPLPVTGAWSGAVAAFVFGVRFWHALILIGSGVLVAGVIVTLISLGVFSFF